MNTFSCAEIGWIDNEFRQVLSCMALHALLDQKTASFSHLNDFCTIVKKEAHPCTRFGSKEPCNQNKKMYYVGATSYVNHPRQLLFLNTTNSSRSESYLGCFIWKTSLQVIVTRRFHVQILSTVQQTDYFCKKKQYLSPIEMIGTYCVWLFDLLHGFKVIL